MSEFKIIETQEELDAVISERLKRERDSQQKKYAEKYSDYDEIKTRNAELEKQIGDMTETIESNKNLKESYEEKLHEKEAAIQGYEKAQLRTRIALENGLPYDLAGRLVGDDEESLIADAKKLAGYTQAAPAAPMKSYEKELSGDDAKYKNLLKITED